MLLLPSTLALLAAAAAPPTLTGEQASRMARELQPRVEQIRGLTFKKKVKVEVVDAATARAHFVKRAQKFWPEKRAQAEERALAQLGLLPPGTRLLEVLLDLMEEQAAAYYDPAGDTFYVMGRMPAALAPAVMVHELTHALDDQHYDIDKMLERVREDDDRSSAVGAVVEGSGTLVMSAFVLDEMKAGRLKAEDLMAFQKSEAGRAERLRKAPPFVQRSLLASYVLGQSFLLRGQLARLQSGVAAEDLDRAFREPPASTEQVVHPDKYWDAAHRDQPRAIRLGDLAAAVGKGWKQAVEGTLGEVTLAVLTGAGPVDPMAAALDAAAWTNAPAAGGDGDRYQLYVNGTQAVTVLATVWDSLEDSGEFEAALRARPGLKTWRRGDTVVVVAGDLIPNAEGLATAALNAVAPYR